MISSFAIFAGAVPLVTVFALLLASQRSEIVKAIALVSAAVSFGVVSVMAFYVSSDVAALCDLPWIDVIHARCKLSLEPIGFAMIWITAFSTLLGVMASIREVKGSAGRVSLHDQSIGFHFALIFLIQAALYGVFTARDLLLFFVFYESVLIPMFLLILVWGGKARVHASMKFLLFTLFGSLPMLGAIVAVGIKTRVMAGHPVFDMDVIAAMDLGPTVSLWIFAGFAMAFLVKIPLWPLHTWLPDAHTEAPTAGSIILAGVLLKMGAFGIIAIAIPLFPSAARAAAPLLQVLALCGILLGALASFAQTDAKRLVAYSSVSHMGLVVLGLFSFTREAWLGAVLQMIAHGISTGALFYFVGALYRRRHDRALESFGGLATLAPNIAGWSAVAVFSSTALPGTAGFAAEVMILYGVFTVSPILAAMAALAMILSAAYMLKFFRYIAFGKPTVEFRRLWDREKIDETAAMAACAAFIVAIGIMPAKIVYDRIDPSVSRLLPSLPSMNERNGSVPWVPHE